MLDMSQIETIRRLEREGYTQTRIAQEMGISRPTVSKYLKMGDFSPRPPVKPAPRPSILDPFKPAIDSMMESDKHVWRKQRHTAKRVYERLVDEYGYEGGYSTVQRYVRARRQAVPADAYLDLVWHPGTAQADFGEADFYEVGARVRRFYLVASFPYSNMGFCQVFSGTTAECVCQGLEDIFGHVGGVPGRIVFDNATGVGRRVSEKIHETELFRAFRLHHGFEATFCNPNAGHEKGNVENKVGFLRSKLFVPTPAYDDVESYNAWLLGRCDKMAGSAHYRSGRPVEEMFAEDREALLPLPETPFDVVRYAIYHASKVGMVTLDGCHAYSTSPACCGHEVIVGVRAHAVTVSTMDGEVVAEHTRRLDWQPIFGQISEDQSRFPELHRAHVA